MLSGTIVFGAGLSILFSNLSAGWAGVAFNFAGQITDLVSGLIRVHSSLEMAMNSVERVEEYSKLEQEPPAIIPGHRPPENWPTQGRVQVVDLTLKYAPELPDVLKRISFNIEANEKIGIVGRTGAGKSTLSMAFFRILPFVEGKIIIDDVDISTIGLHDLRSRLTIIPQDPILFEGTLRSNLDPLHEKDDALIWDAVKQTGLIESLQRLDGSSGGMVLDSHVAENGSNFSQGQRQLLCLARALLRSSRFIFMDEATASVDHESDIKIQDTIRNRFKEGCVLTVAHRIKTVIDYDRIMVLDDGNIVELDTPRNLFEKQGNFYKMCQESGDFEELKRYVYDN